MLWRTTSPVLIVLLSTAVTASGHEPTFGLVSATDRQEGGGADAGTQNASRLDRYKPSPTVDGRQVERPTVDGRQAGAPAPAAEAAGQHAVSSPPRPWAVDGSQPAAPRRFSSWDEFAAFATRHMRARVQRAPDGSVRFVHGRYVRSGNGKPLGGVDYIARYLGGDDGVLTVASRRIGLGNAAATDGAASLRPVDEQCFDGNCLAGESWVTHSPAYHSVGSRTTLVSGGVQSSGRPCCRSGEMMRQNGLRRCRSKRRGAWEYDRRLGRLVPTAPNPYVYTEPSVCRRDELRNQLGVRARVLFGPAQSQVVEHFANNASEVEIGEWLITVRLDLETQSIDEVTGICGFHSLSPGGFIETTDGFTGDDDVLCQSPVPFRYSKDQ
jgi:hypothetical protein